MHRIWVDGTEFRWTERQPQHDNRDRSNVIGGSSNSTKWGQWCPSRDDGWGEFVCPLGPAELRQGRPKDRSTLSSNPMMEGPWCRFRREARTCERYRHRNRGWYESTWPWPAD